MRTLLKVLVVAALLAPFGIFASCGTDRASDQQIDQMCNKLVSFYTEEEAASKTRFTKCKQEAQAERPYISTAECRAKSTSTDQYWNSCR